MSASSCLTSPCPGQVTGSPALLFNQLILSLYASQCTLGDPRDYPLDYGQQIQEEEQFDFIVVGAGSAGSVVARRLAEVEDWKILLIEAGGNPPAHTDIPIFNGDFRDSEIDWAYRSIPQSNCCKGMNNNQCVVPRGKVLGGSSTVNAMYYVRGNKEDYDEWERQGNTGWGYKRVLEYFKKSEMLVTKNKLSSTYHSQAGLLGVSYFDTSEGYQNIRKQFLRSVREAGYKVTTDINGASQIGFTEVQRTALFGRRSNTAKAFLGAQTFTNLHVVKQAHVKKLQMEGYKAVGVVYIREGKETTVRATKEVILSAGSINTPQILLLSGIGPKNHLEELKIPLTKDIPGVGKNLQDHFFYAGTVFTIKSVSQCPDPKDYVYAMGQYLLQPYNPGLLGSWGYSELVGFTDTRGRSSVPDIQFHGAAYCGKDNGRVRLIFDRQNFREEVAGNNINANSSHDYVILWPVLLAPRSRGEVYLNTSDPTGAPLINLNMFSDPSDIEAMARGVRAVLNILKTKTMQRLDPKVINFSVPECSNMPEDARMRCLIPYLSSSLFHPSGTCKMGPVTDPMAVVDPRLKVHGLYGLRVVDSSIFPRNPRGNTNAAAIMVGEMAADIIKQDHKRA